MTEIPASTTPFAMKLFSIPTSRGECSNRQKSDILSIIVLVLLLSQLCSAELWLPSLFSDHMVVQREKPISIWGKGTPGQRVTVCLAGQNEQVMVAKDGRWQARLPQQGAGGPYVLQVKHGEEVALFNDVYVGEVWICSGQSNMAFGFNWLKEEADRIRLESKGMNLRHFHVNNTVSFTEEEDCNGGQWDVDFTRSAVGATFQHHMAKRMPGVAIAVINASWGSSSIEGWMPLSMRNDLPHFDVLLTNQDENERAEVEGILERAAQKKRGKRWSNKEDITLRTKVNIPYNAMMHPINSYTVRGIIWYQGEANSKRLDDMVQYGVSLPAWVTEMRQRKQDDELHVMVVGLPGFKRTCKMTKGKGGDPLTHTHPAALTWAFFRERQQTVLELDQTSYINTVDLGSAGDIHPRDKEPIGLRCALTALKQIHAYDIVADGPQVVSCEFAGAQAVLRYDQTGLRTVDGAAPTGFWVKDAAGTWHAARAHLKKDIVSVTADGVSKPVELRYAYAGKPVVNLVNAEGLPAYPFTSHPVTADQY